MNNIILAGFMGTGKTTVGRLLAAQTGRGFADTDVYVEEQAGRCVAALFDGEGEAAFRRREARACAELAARAGLVIALGGGALLAEENRRVLAASGRIVLLEVPPEVLWERLRGDVSRPLLRGADPRGALEALYAARLPRYRAAAHLTVDAAASPAEVAARIRGLLGGDLGG